MSTKIYDENNMSITSFFGGKSRGRCLQFLTGECSEYTEEQVREIADAINTWLLEKP